MARRLAALATGVAPATIRRLPPSALRVHGALLTVSVLFGANYVVTKRLLAGIPAGSWVLFRMVAATAVTIPLVLLLARGRPWPSVRRWPLLALAALLGVALNQVLFTEGMARTTPAHSAVVNACIPTWTLLIAVLAGQERLTGTRVLAIVSALCGVCWLLGVDRLLLAAGADPHAGAGAGAGAGATWLGDLLTMGNGIAFACHLVLLRAIGRDLDPYRTTALLFLFGTPMIAAWSAPAVDGAHVAAVTSPPFVWLATYAVLAATVLTYFLNPWALRHTHSSQVALYINVQPLVAASLGAALGEGLPGQRFFVALGLVAFGLWLQTRSRPA
jgi:drug/metabolite transporter (DMT)-like permease